MSGNVSYPYRTRLDRECHAEVRQTLRNGYFFGQAIIDDTGHPGYIMVETELKEDQALLVLRFPGRVSCLSCQQ